MNEAEAKYLCPVCNKPHSLSSDVGIDHLKHVLRKADIPRFLDFSFTAGAHGYITANTQQYLRDSQVFGALDNKFQTAGMFGDTTSAQDWLKRYEAQGNLQHVLSRLQGDGAGEVDAMRLLNSRLDSMIYKTQFISDTSGHISSNTPAIDLQKVNRITGQIAEEIQVKTPWSTNPAALRKHITDFLNNREYHEGITLAGPRELIDQARQMEVPNKLVVIKNTGANRESAERLADMVRNRDSSIDAATPDLGITFQSIQERIAKGAVIGAALSITIACLTNYIAFRQNRITAELAFQNIALDAGSGTVTGGALGGLSLVFPPGAVGVGIGILAGTQIRRIVDVAFGKGAFKAALDALGALEAGIDITADGIAVLAQGVAFSEMAYSSAVADLQAYDAAEAQTNEHLAQLKAKNKGYDTVEDSE